MIILQAGFLNGQFFIAGETPPEEASSSSSRKKKTKPTISPSPFDPGDKALTTLLKEVGPDLTNLKPEKVIAWLPTANEQPVASSPLIAEPPAAGAKLTLHPWQVTAVPLSAEEVIGFLSTCIGKEMLQPGVVIGKTLAYWTVAFRFAGALVAREQFLPGIREDDKSSRACWEPILNGEDRRRFGELAKNMPSACRAWSRDVETEPDTPASVVLAGFVQTMVDTLVRQTTVSAPPAQKADSRRKKGAFDSIHDEWLNALASDEATLEGKKTEQQQLIQQIQDWRRPINISSSAPFRLCFRLEEPEEKENNGKSPTKNVFSSDKWYLRYLLQGTDDPSLLIPVEEAWKSKGKKSEPLTRSGFNAQEYLLTALGQAAAIYPTIEKSLKASAPAGCQLNVQGAHDFLTEKAWVLESAGFNVLLPAWWTRKGTKNRLGVRAYVKAKQMPGASTMTLESLVQFDWKVALGDETLTKKELETLADLKVPLVKVRGQWVQVSAEEIQAALNYWKQKGGGEATLREMVQMALGAKETTEGLPFEGVEASGWLKDFLKQLEGEMDFETLEQPGDFQGTLRPYQQRGYSWLSFLQRWGLGACLADDMGLGKTIQTLALIERLWESGNKRPTLLVCPMSVVGNWKREAEKFTLKLPVVVHHGQKRQKGKAFENQTEKHALILSSYSLLHRDFDLLKRVKWGGVILDEAQNIKNPETKQAKSARSLPADYRIALTGTPVENHVGDLWSIMEFLNPGFLGKSSEFRQNFLIPIQAYGSNEAGNKLKQLTGPFILRRLKTDKDIISDLPEKLEMKVYCNLTKEQASLYEAVVKDANKSLEEQEEGIKRKGVILGILTKLKQVCNHPAHFLGGNSSLPGRSGKLARLTEMLEEILEVGDRALIFSQFTEMGNMLKRHIQNTFAKEALFLHGGVSKKERDRMVARFQGEESGSDQPQIFLLSLKAGRTGLNLTAANHVFHFDRWWNPAVENQATDRAFRIGQSRNVQVHKFLCVGTLEERINEMIEHKQEVAGKVVGTGEKWLTELSNEQLKDLFTLRKEALGE